MHIRNVLIFPAATEVGLEINEALRQCKEVRIFGAGVGGATHGPFAYERFLELPSIHDEGWLNKLIELCVTHDIHYIFPAYDDVIVELAQKQKEIPATVLTAPLDVCLLTRSKRATYNALESVIRVPRVFDSQPTEFPVFVKPDRGQGSQGARVIREKDQLEAALREDPALLISEYLPGPEFTVDCFSDREKGLLFAKARARNRTRNGIAVNTTTVDLPEARQLAERIQARLPLHGTWFFQIKQASDGEFALLEVAPRIAGSMSTHRVLGVNFPLLSIFEHERLPLSILINDGSVELDRALKNRFRHSIAFRSLYIDLDDTLILRGQVNLDAIRLVYLARNLGATITLLTRHAGNLDATLQQYALTGLFDEVIHLRQGQRKSDYVTGPAAIFVDDSFAERLDVSNRHKIPTFDCSMIELLTSAAIPDSEVNR